MLIKYSTPIRGTCDKVCLNIGVSATLETIVLYIYTLSNLAGVLPLCFLHSFMGLVVQEDLKAW